MIEVEIQKNEDQQRLDKFLKKYLPNAPLSFIFKLIRKKDVKINDKRAGKDAVIKEGDLLKIYITDDDYEKFKNRRKKIIVKKEFDIAFEDENILVVDKPKGLLVHGTAEEKKNTLVNQVLSYLQSKDEYDPRKEKTFVPAAVNRLDRNTSGLVLFGKNYGAVKCLNQMIKEKNNIRKYYLTIVSGHLTKEQTLVDHVSKNESKNMMKIENQQDNTKQMETIIKPVRRIGNNTLVEVEIITGRTHQIRVHLASIRHPIIGDSKYGKKIINEEMKRRFGIDSQVLHSYKLYFENMIEPLAYLEGKVIETALPNIYEKIEEALS